ncbi:MAG: PQQ-binding-like beta-propeller repeat protein, partial [Planctomycetes bacterium]|nr:PQQ-binding-like beta-propeller repeat protein [Planctomycetota bacterium]
SPSPAPAAPPSPPPPGEEGTWSVEDSEEVRSRLDEADRLLGRGLPEKGVLLLQEILDRYPRHLVRTAEDPLLFLGARAVVMERIASLSPEAREAYRRTFGPVAEEALAAALRTRDPAALAALGDRYLLAGPAGPRALLALADLRLARGEPGLAVAPLRELLRRFPGSPEGGPAVAARLARALARIRDHDGLEALRSSPALPPGAAVRAGGVEVPLSRILEEAAAEAGPRRGGGDAATLGGGPSRSGAGAAVPPLGAPRWIEGSPRFNWTDTDFRQINRETSVEQAVKASQPVVPCIVDGVVFFHWQGDVHARDLYTGKERWHFRGPEIPRLESARTHASWLASPTVKDGVLYAGLMAWPLGERVRTIYFAGQDIIPYLPTRRLFALDAGTGALLWSHADPRPAGDPFADRLSRLNATAAPLVLGDLVISAGAAYRSQFEAAAFAADRRTGEVRWVTPLGFGQQEQNLFGRPVKEVAVAAVASDGDRVFVQTNMGLLSCLEASTGRPLWTRGYRQVEIPYYQTFWTTPEREFTFTGSPPVVSGGVVVVAPADGASVLAFEAATGKFLWSAPGRDGRRSSDPRMTRLLGADGDCAYLAGTGVRALELRTGRLAWDQPFDTRHQEECSGRGVLSGGLLHVPTNRALWVLEARGAGRVVRKDPWVRADGEVAGRAGGNLVTAEGAAVIARLYQMEGHFSAENVAARVAALLAERPEDPSALLEAARAYLAADRHEAALPLLRRALAGAAALPPGERERMEVQVRTGIFAVLETRASALSAAGKPEEAQRAFAEAARNAADPADAAGVLLRGARLLQDADRFDLAAPLVEAVVRDHPDARLVEERHLVDRSPGASTAASYALFYLGVWLSALDRDAEALAAMQRIQERPDSDVVFGGPAREVARLFTDQVIRRRGPAVYAPFEAKAAAALAQARAAKDPQALLRVLRIWPNSEAGLAAALDGARLLLGAGDPAGAQSAARGVLALDPGDDAAAAAAWILAESLARSGKAAAARSQFLRLARRFPASPIETGGAVLPAAEAVKRRLAAGDLESASSEAASLPATGPYRTLWERSAAAGALPRPLFPGGDPVGGRLLFLQAGPAISGVDAATGEERWSAAHPSFLGEAAWCDGVLLFAHQDEAAGLEAATGRMLWSTPLPGNAVGLCVSEGVAVLLLESTDDMETVSLFALDPATGEAVWGGPREVPGGAQALAPVPGGVLLESFDGDLPMVRVVEAGDGSFRPWHVPLRGGEDEAQAELLPHRGGPLVLLRTSDLRGFDPHRGARVFGWSPEEGKGILAAAAGPAAAAALDETGLLTAVDAEGGRVLWTARAGEGRMFDPSSTALLVDERWVVAATSAEPEGRGTRIEARDARTGALG